MKSDKQNTDSVLSAATTISHQQAEYLFFVVFWRHYLRTLDVKTCLRKTSTAFSHIKLPATTTTTWQVLVWMFHCYLNIKSWLFCLRCVFQPLVWWVWTAAAAAVWCSGWVPGRGGRPETSSLWSLKPWGILGRCCTQREREDSASVWS